MSLSSHSLQNQQDYSQPLIGHCPHGMAETCPVLYAVWDVMEIVVEVAFQ